MTAPVLTVDWATGASGVLTQVTDAVTAGWPIGALVIGVFVGFKMIKRFVRG